MREKNVQCGLEGEWWFWDGVNWVGPYDDYDDALGSYNSFLSDEAQAKWENSPEGQAFLDECS